MITNFSKNYILNNLDLSTYYNNNNHINDAFIITLDKDKQRYDQTLKILNNLNLNCIKFPAIYGKTLKLTNPNIYHKFKKINSGEIGCACSHLIIYYIASQHKNQNAYTLIFEDDIILKNDITPDAFNKKITNAISHNPDIVYLGKCFEYCNKIKNINDDLYYGYKPVCFHAYIIKNSFAKNIVNYVDIVKTINKPIDSLVTFLSKPKKTLIFHPSIFNQNLTHPSNLRDIKVQKYNNTECKKLEHFENINKTKNGLIEFVKQYVNNMDDLLTQYNDNPYVISLDKDIVKYNNTKEILKQLDFIPNKFNAIYGKQLQITNPEIFELFDNLSPSEIGCFISHVIVIYIISKQHNDYGIVFEDDIALNPNINPNDIIQKINSVKLYNANIVYLGKCLEQCITIKPINNETDLYYGSSPLCLHAYMIKNTFAKQIIEYLENQDIYNLPIDKIILNVTKNKEEIIIFHPSLIIQDYKYDSNLRSKFSQQFNSYECKTGDFNKLCFCIIIIITIVLFYIRN